MDAIAISTFRSKKCSRNLECTGLENLRAFYKEEGTLLVLSFKLTEKMLTRCLRTSESCKTAYEVMGMGWLDPQEAKRLGSLLLVCLWPQLLCSFPDLICSSPRRRQQWTRTCGRTSTAGVEIRVIHLHSRIQRLRKGSSRSFSNNSGCLPALRRDHITRWGIITRAEITA